jgi:serine/threonine protein kinase
VSEFLSWGSGKGQNQAPQEKQEPQGKQQGARNQENSFRTMNFGTLRLGRQVGHGSYCQVFQQSASFVCKVMDSDDGDGFSQGLLREVSFYASLPRTLVPYQRVVSGVPQLLVPKFLPVQVKSSTFQHSFGLQFPRMMGDMWFLGRKKWFRKELKTTVPIVVHDITVALSRLHASGILHRDLKPANILTDIEHFYLIDFGSSNFEAVETRCGGNCTHAYCAPEAGPEREDPGVKDTQESDLFSLGACIISLVTNTFPLVENLYDWKQTLESFSWPKDLPTVWKDSLLKSVDRDPQARGTLMDLAHAFCSGSILDTIHFGVRLPWFFSRNPFQFTHTLDEYAEKQGFPWNSAHRVRVLTWMESVFQEQNWSRFAFVVSLQMLNDLVLMRGLWDVLEKLLGTHSKFQLSFRKQCLLAVTIVSLAHKAFEDTTYTLTCMADMTDRLVSEILIFHAERIILEHLDFVLVRRSNAGLLCKQSWDTLLKLVHKDVI